MPNGFSEVSGGKLSAFEEPCGFLFALLGMQFHWKISWKKPTAFLLQEQSIVTSDSMF